MTSIPTNPHIIWSFPSFCVLLSPRTPDKLRRAPEKIKERERKSIAKSGLMIFFFETSYEPGDGRINCRGDNFWHKEP